MRVLVDTSVWIDYFRGGDRSACLDGLIDDGLIVSNELILAELVPSLKLRRQHRLVGLLEVIERLPLGIDWEGIIALQLQCLKNGANGIGIPDLIIAQNARAHDCLVYSLDRHFGSLQRLIGLRLYE